MVWLKWLPWRFAVSKLAQRHGFLDPIAVMARMRGFTQPSEVAEPIELLRAGAVLHARGLINSRVIQHNLDWVWPYWVERQFDPGDPAFIPRAFSITHINLTHRNWTAVGQPDCPHLPIVDPRGLVTPHFNGWSLDGWVVSETGEEVLPSRTANTRQRLDLRDNVSVRTESSKAGLSLATEVWVDLEAGRPVCRVDYTGRADGPAAMVISLRPCNPEGVSFVHEVRLADDRSTWSIDGQESVEFSDPLDRHHVSNYHGGDVHIHLADREDQQSGRCEVGMATAAAMYRLTPGTARRVTATVPLADEPADTATTDGWRASLEGFCRLALPDRTLQFLYDAAIRMLILHAWGDVVPGPFTYKRFWFRDAAFLISALLAAGLTGRAERAIDGFPSRQTRSGFFHSQDGEWDSNGQALWIMHRFCALTGRPPKRDWQTPIDRAARWIVRKRISDSAAVRHAGLLPAGFSAEHLGPNDYYYWDDFWGVAGLKAAAGLSSMAGKRDACVAFGHEANAFAAALESSLGRDLQRLRRAAMPASPYRRLDAGAVGSIVAGYPLQLFEPDDPRLLDTVEYLLDSHFVDGGFFQDMTHSGINAYLTLHIAQILLRAGDRRCFDLIDTVARLATPTGQWPEAIHPATGGGCMGDGQHIWAAAEWILMIRNCFVREEGDELILASGVPQLWLQEGFTLRFGPAPTTFGTITLSLVCRHQTVGVEWQSNWHRAAPVIRIQLPGMPAINAEPGVDSVEVERVIAA